ncbi:U7 snRNA binding protein [Aureococcus anophagefferens]|nr:U7 snRNA binding protein [Aureococcus anophagefferens]
MAAAAKAVGVPIKLLHEGEGHMVTIELKNGEIYRGHLDESEETMNCLVTDVVVTARDGRVTKLENVYIRGSQIKRERRAFRVRVAGRPRAPAGS